MTNVAAGEMQDTEPLTIDIERQRAVITLRAVLALLLAVGLATLLRLDASIFTLVPTLIILFFFRNESYLAGLSLVGGVFLGGLVEVVVIHLFLSSHFIFFVVNAVLILLGSYWIAQAMRGLWPLPFMAIFALLAMTSAIFQAMDTAQGGLQTALYWSLESSIGILCTWFVTKVVWPFPRSADLVSTIRSVECACAVLLRRVASRYEAKEPPTYVPSPLSLIYFKTQLDAIEIAKTRLMRDDPSYTELKRRLERVRAAYVHARLAARSLAARRCRMLEEPERQAVVGEMRRLSDMLGDPAAVPAGDEDCGAIPGHLPVLKRNMAIIAHNIRLLRSEVDDVHEPPRQTVNSVQTASSRFTLDTGSLKKAIKLTLALVICLVIHLTPHLPAGNFLVIGAIIVLIQPNTGRSRLRVRLWIVGVLAGTLLGIAALGLVAALPHLPILLLVLAVGFLAGGYYAAGPDEVSYAGLQFCITLVIVLGLSALPVDTATGAEGRVFGAAIGFLVALAIALGLWPDRPVDMLRHGVAASLRKAAALLSDLLGDPQPSHVTPERFREALYVDIRGNLEILHDASFIPDSQMKDHPDYKNMIHVSGMLFAQLFTLWDMLMRCETAQQRARVLGPLSTHGDAIVARLDDIADRIETQTFDVMSDIREQLRELHIVPFADTGNGSGEETEPEVIREERFFGIQIANDIIADLVFLVDDLGSGPKTDPLPAEVAVGAIEGS